MSSLPVIPLYIDVGSAAYVLQIALAVVGGAIVYVLFFGKRLLLRVRNLFMRSSSGAEPEPGQAEESE
jgi:hypothetical protein